MDLSGQAKKAELDIDSYKSLLATFVGATDRDLARLEQAVKEGDTPTAAGLAHHIKGAAANLELEEIRAAALCAELAGKAGNLAEVAPQVAIMTARLEEIRAALE